VGRGLCLNCLLYRGLGEETYDNETLESVLDEVDVPDADWRLGNYQILEEIGRGGMGVIYRARQRHSRRIVALKRILAYHSDSRETLVRFRREAEAAASLDHPNILPIYEVGESDDGLPFFSMKLATGGSLLESHIALYKDPRRSVALMAKVCRAVQYAHAQGILHRDLKPGNILLDGHGEPLVSDFGLAKWLDTTSDLTRTLTVFGTPGYIAPEQANGPAGSLKPTADIYSLGAILFDLLAGRPPFLGEHALSVIQQAADKPAPKLRSLKPSLDRDLETICSRCLERESAARYRSAGDLAEDLERWLEGRPIVARPVSPAVRTWRWSKRNPKLAGSVVACFALGVAAIIWQSESRQLSATVRQDQLAARSIAVLPFLDLDQASSDSVFGDLLAKSLQQRLNLLGPVRITSLKNLPAAVAGGGSAQDIKRAGQEANARTVLTGTKRSSAGKLRVSIRLMDSSTGGLLALREFEDLAAATQGDPGADIARTIYSILSTEDWSELTASKVDPGLRNDVSREAMIAGRELTFRYGISDFDRAIELFRQALKAEPKSALAHAYLASAAAARTHYFSDLTFLRLAEKEVNTALALSPNLPDAHRAYAGILYQQGKFRAALEEQMRTIELGGLEERVARFIGMTMKDLGRPDRALVWQLLARHWEARPGDTDTEIADCWFSLGDNERAEGYFKRSADLHPELPDGWIGHCRVLLLQGKLDAARELCQKFEQKHGDFLSCKQMRAQVEFLARNYAAAEFLYKSLADADPGGGGTFYGAISYKSALGRIRQALGRSQEARPLLEDCVNQELENLKGAPDNPDALYRLAAVESTMGSTQASLDHLTSAGRVGYLDHRYLRLDPRFDNLRSDPGFKKTLDTLTSAMTEMRQRAVSRTTDSL